MDPLNAPRPLRLRLATTCASMAVCRLEPTSPIPGWATAGSWWSVSRTEAELSIVCEERWVPAGMARSGPWRALMVEGPVDHALVGVLAALAAPLAAAQVPIFAVSTYDTDWVLVPEDRLGPARVALLGAGHGLAP